MGTATAQPCLVLAQSHNHGHNHVPQLHIGEGHIHPTLHHLEDVTTNTNVLPLRQDYIFPRLSQTPVIPPHSTPPLLGTFRLQNNLLQSVIL